MHGFITFIANYALVISIVGLLAAFLSLDNKSKRKRFLVQFITGAVIVIVIARLGSWLYYNPRPFVVGHFVPYFSHPNNNGFPSDHTLFTSYLAFLVFYYNRKLGVVLLITAIAVGLARVVSGVHHFVDIIGAFFITGIAAIISGSVVSIMYRTKSDEKAEKSG
jgi:undecaprenyl-diphosphatase